MKKFITILFMFSFLANAQRTLQPTESYAFTTDKQLHTLVGGVSSAGMFLFASSKGADEEEALIASCVFPSLLGLGKEWMDGYNFSLADWAYTSGSGIIVGFTMYGLKKWKNKRQAKKIKQRFDISFLPDLRDEPLIKNL